MRKPRTIAAAAALTAIATAVALPPLSGARPSHGHAAAAKKKQTIRVFDVPFATTLTTTGGKVISRPPYPNPKAGDVLDVYSLEYAGNHRHHARHWSMSAHLECTFGHGQPVCASHVAVGGSLLVFKGNKLVGGTGRYKGATGRVISNKEVPGTANASDVVARIKLR